MRLRLQRAGAGPGRLRFAARVASLLLGAALAAAAALADDDCREIVSGALPACLARAGWRQEQDTDGVQVYSRSRPGSAVREVLATTRIRAPAAAILARLTDFEQYTDFMPDTLEACVQLHREGDTYWVFQQLDLPFVADRYYTLRLDVERDPDRPERVALVWRLAQAARFQRQGHGRRVAFNNGYWSLHGQPDGSTQVRYYIHTDPGHLWHWVVDLANRVAVPDVVKALRRQFE